MLLLNTALTLASLIQRQIVNKFIFSMFLAGTVDWSVIFTHHEHSWLISQLVKCNIASLSMLLNVQAVGGLPVMHWACLQHSLIFFTNHACICLCCALCLYPPVVCVLSCLWFTPSFCFFLLSFIFCFPPLLSSCWKRDSITTVRVLAQTGLSDNQGSVSFLIL